MYTYCANNPIRYFDPSGHAKDYLSNGDKGDNVAYLQRELMELGYYHGDIDGKFGPQTEKAVKSFQKSAGLKVDGYAGAMTMTALDGWGGSNPAKASKDTSKALKENKKEEKKEEKTSKATPINNGSGNTNKSTNEITKIETSNVNDKKSGINPENIGSEGTGNAVLPTLKNIQYQSMIEYLKNDTNLDISNHIGSTRQ